MSLATIRRRIKQAIAPARLRLTIQHRYIERTEGLPTVRWNVLNPVDVPCQAGQSLTLRDDLGDLVQITIEQA
jgi:hypothetical protein